MAAPTTADLTPFVAHRGLDSVNSPAPGGFIGGSLRRSEDSETIGGRLRPSLRQTFRLALLSVDRALVPGSVSLVLRCRAQKSDSTNVLTADPIALIEEASSLWVREVKLSVNGVTISRHDRSDVVRHVVDRYFSTSKLDQSETHRQLNPDTALTTTAGTPITADIFKHDQILDDLPFELIRPLDDLPLFGSNDSHLPGWNTVKIEVTTTSNPQNLFRTDATVAASPFLVVEDMLVRYSTVKMEDSVAASMRLAAAAGNAEFNGTQWSAIQLTPTIPAGATTYRSSIENTFSSIPDVVLFSAFPSATFEPPADSFKVSQHPMLKSFINLSELKFVSGGEALRDYPRLSGIGGKIQLLEALKESINTEGGDQKGTGSKADKSCIQGDVFVREPGTGLVPLVFRNWHEMLAEIPVPVSIRIDAKLADPAAAGAPVEVVPFMISAVRHRWALSPVSGATRLVL